MAKKDTKNVAEQLKKFNKNIESILDKVDEEIPVREYNFKPKVVVEPIIETPTKVLPINKLSKDELVDLINQIPTIQTGLRQEIIYEILSDGDVEIIENKLKQLHTFDLRLIDTILINL